MKNFIIPALMCLFVLSPFTSHAGPKTTGELKKIVCSFLGKYGYETIETYFDILGKSKKGTKKRVFKDHESKMLTVEIDGLFLEYEENDGESKFAKGIHSFSESVLIFCEDCKLFLSGGEAREFLSYFGQLREDDDYWFVGFGYSGTASEKNDTASYALSILVSKDLAEISIDRENRHAYPYYGADKCR